MADKFNCPECGRPLAEGALEGVCPVCSLRNALVGSDAPLEPHAASCRVTPSYAAGEPLTTRFGDYELLELLARGGMGVVYKACQISLNRVVALKMIQAGVLATPAEVKRFHVEAEAIAQFHHPNIVAVYEIGEREGQHFFSMEYVAGRTLAEIVRDGPLPATRAATYVKTVAAAVHYAHQHGILHRDLKPANIIIEQNDQPRITDFGLAKHLSPSAESGVRGAELTLSGQVLGSPSYLPPEQAEPKRGVLGPPSDVYALGAILYHLITGRPPFQAESLTTLLRQVIETEPVAPRSLNPGIPRDLETICLKCLEKEPQHRYGTAQALEDDLGHFLNREPVLARPVAAPGRAWRWSRRRPVLASLGAALVVVLVLAVSGITWQWRRAERERDMALRLAYAGDMDLVQRSLEEGDLGRARGLLERYRPKGKSGIGNLNSENDLRGWEWRYLWGLLRSDDHVTLAKSSSPFAELTFAPGGKLLAARHAGETIEVWDLDARQRTVTLASHNNTAWGKAMAFSPDARFLISANWSPGGEPVVSLWEVKTGQVVRDLAQPSEVLALALSSDGKLLATCHMSRFRLWELASGKLLRELPIDESYTGTQPVALFSPDGAMLALGDNSGQIRLLNLSTGEINAIRVPCEGEGVWTLAFSPDSQLLASSYGWTDSAIYLWEVATGQQFGRLEGHRNWVEALAFAPDRQTLYSASFDQSIGIWDVAQRKQIRWLHGHTGMVSGLALSPDKPTLMSCSHDGSIRSWDLRARPRPAAKVVLPVSIGVFGGSVFLADSRSLITASKTNLVTVWEVGTTNVIEQIAALGTNNQSLALSPNERLLAVGGWDGTLKVWDLKNRCIIKQWRPYPGIPVFGLLFLDGGKSLASFGMAPGALSDVRRWEVGSWRELSFGNIDLEHCFGLAQSPDQQLLATIYEGQPVKIWDSASRRCLATLGSAGGFTPVFSPDGRLVAAAVRSCARIWEVGSWRQVAMLEKPAGDTECVAFSPDGKRLAVGSLKHGKSRHGVHLWDYLAERELLSLQSEDRWTGWIQFSPDGNTLLAVSWYGLAELWRAPSWAEIQEAEKQSEHQ